MFFPRRRCSPSHTPSPPAKLLIRDLNLPTLSCRKVLDGGAHCSAARICRAVAVDIPAARERVRKCQDGSAPTSAHSFALARAVTRACPPTLPALRRPLALQNKVVSAHEAPAPRLGPLHVGVEPGEREAALLEKLLLRARLLDRWVEQHHLRGFSFKTGLQLRTHNLRVAQPCAARALLPPPRQSLRKEDAGRASSPWPGSPAAL